MSLGHSLMLRASSILGFTDSATIRLDFDDMRIESVKYWALKINGKPKLGGGMILRLSEDAYHMAFAVMFLGQRTWALWLGLPSSRRVFHCSDILRCNALRELSLLGLLRIKRSLLQGLLAGLAVKTTR